MAQYYTGNLLDPYRWVATARSKPGEYSTLDDFVSDVNLWLKKHNINYKWQGHSTHTNNDVTHYQYNVTIGDDNSRTLFNLRWT